jgi:hypothetical protein
MLRLSVVTLGFAMIHAAGLAQQVSEDGTVRYQLAMTNLQLLTGAI